MIGVRPKFTLTPPNSCLFNTLNIESCHQRLTHEWPSNEEGRWAPKVSLHWKDGKFFLHAELPGVDQRDLTVSIKGKTLTLSGTREVNRALCSDPDYYLDEVDSGPFLRIVLLPDEMDEESVKSAFFNGMLILVMEPIGK